MKTTSHGLNWTTMKHPLRFPSQTPMYILSRFCQLMQALRGITSSVIEEASLNTAKRSLAMTMLAKVTRSLPSPNKHNDVRMQDDEELSRTLHTAQHWICIIQHELHKPDMSFLDPRASSSNSAVTIVSELLSAARFCCLAIRCEKLPRHFKRPLRSLQNCVECAFASMASGQETLVILPRGADRERASQCWHGSGRNQLVFLSLHVKLLRRATQLSVTRVPFKLSAPPPLTGQTFTSQTHRISWSVPQHPLIWIATLRNYTENMQAVH